MAKPTKKSTPKTKTAAAKSKSVAKKSTKSVAAKAKTKTSTASKRVSSKKTTAKKASTSAAKKVSASKSTNLKQDKPKKDAFKSLRSWNRGLFLLHGAQAVAMGFLAKDFRLPVDVSFITQNESTQSLETATRTVVDVPLAWLLIGFLAMSSIAHFIIAGPWFKNYVSDLKQGINRARWIEYALSASTMMVAISLLVGISSLSLLISIFMFTLLMNWTGYTMEKANQGQDKENIKWGQFVLGSVAGIVPWVVVGLSFVWNAVYSTSTPPAFVYWIYVSIFAFFNAFAINMYLQYKKKGKWADYLYGEKAYMVLSLVAKSALAWQVFAGTLRP